MGRGRASGRPGGFNDFCSSLALACSGPRDPGRCWPMAGGGPKESGTVKSTPSVRVVRWKEGGTLKRKHGPHIPSAPCSLQHPGNAPTGQSAHKSRPGFFICQTPFSILHVKAPSLRDSGAATRWPPPKLRMKAGGTAWNKALVAAKQPQRLENLLFFNGCPWWKTGDKLAITWATDGDGSPAARECGVGPLLPLSRPS